MRINIDINFRASSIGFTVKYARNHAKFALHHVLVATPAIGDIQDGGGEGIRISILDASRAWSNQNLDAIADF